MRALEVRRHALVERSAAQRREIAAALCPVAAKLAGAQRFVSGLRSALGWALRLMPLYALLRRRRGSRLR